MGSSIPMLQGWGDGVADLGKGLDQLINPNHQVQNALKQAALSNPELIPQLAELERSNPGTLEKLGLGQSGLMQMLGHGSNKLIDQISTTPESAKMKEDAAQKAANVKRTDSESANLQANTNLTTGITPSTIALKTSEANVAKGTEGSVISSAKSAAALAKNKARESDVNIANMETGLKKYPELSNIDLSDVASKIFHGQKLDAALSTRIQNDPALASSLDSYTKAMAERARNDTEMDVQSLRNRGKPEQAMAFTQVTQSLAELQRQESTKQMLIHQSMPSMTDLATAKMDGDIGNGAREKIKLWEDAQKELKSLTKQVDDTRAMQKELSDILVDKVKTNPEASTKQNNTNSTSITKTTNKKNVTPAVQKILDTAKKAGLGKDVITASEAFKSLTEAERNDLLSRIP